MQIPGYLGFAPLTIMYYYNDTVLHIYKRYVTADGEGERKDKGERGRDRTQFRKCPLLRTPYPLLEKGPHRLCEEALSRILNEGENAKAGMVTPVPAWPVINESFLAERRWRIDLIHVSRADGPPSMSPFRSSWYGHGTSFITLMHKPPWCLTAERRRDDRASTSNISFSRREINVSSLTDRTIETATKFLRTFITFSISGCY